ncbi:hypothetical protein JX265_002610 [Neoarthrinium moseri]|uniref:Large ribosomal subunit protein mL49 n=1 Tax=Neoarthrinium moseri TaxID=1658444 RepID=A0A9Q0AUY4_9PEZI|nr:uncharacterized protein JN550_000423 [Neoarthrinium moseri]KAI1878241.1 hypothetical protein JN550_000423 [Neoarthrinium moseri]KAI1879656.1 hypothetical protein JX265_002610 [Neoarthrinium moseri]
MFSRTLRPLRAANALRTATPTYRMSPVALRTLTTEAASASASEPSTAQQTPSAIPQTPEAPARSPSQLPYFVGRNRLNNFGIYEKRLRGGTMKKTLLKKGEGNLQALRHDVAEALSLPAKEVRVNNVTGHIEIKGHRRDGIAMFLKNMGF